MLIVIYLCHSLFDYLFLKCQNYLRSSEHTSGICQRRLSKHIEEIEMNALKILVLDDNETHRISAVRQLAGHNLTVLASYSEASEHLKSKVDYDKVHSMPQDMSFEDRVLACTTYPSWDMVLLDLMLPADRGGDFGRIVTNEAFSSHGGQEMPLGTILAFQALKAGVKRVGVLTDTNHHKHFASAGIDMLQSGRKPVCVGDANLFFTNYLGTLGMVSEEVEIGRDEKPWLAVYHILCGTYRARPPSTGK